MWTVQRDDSGPVGTLGLRFFAGEDCLSYADFLRALVQNADFREVIQPEMPTAPFAAFRWETPPLISTNSNQPFQCLLHDSPDLNVQADPTDFATHFRSDREVVHFENLGADAMLIVPCPTSTDANYCHIGAFHRSAPPGQQHAFWETVAKVVMARLGPRPLWLSTAGGGVDWLHMRVDDRPKYYLCQPWRSPAQEI